MKTIIFIISLTFSTLCMAQDSPHCKGKTKKGTACKATIVGKSGYCYQHDPATKHCAHEGCKRVVKKGDTLCSTHTELK